ncbi:hypothetical protein [Segetibacter sp. 3557_3]|uniref:hypothetical protein n=1 Tax=Segetibacter sp. 3557_3 TaxID=2547429 RepID=UPI00140432E1|nr:hypothetical protein [Segetibacter sp. 3557_3]
MKILCILALVVTTTALAAQQPSGIVNAYAFMREHFAGTIAVDDQGNPMQRGVDTVNLVYIETKGNDVPTIKRAWRNGQAYQVSLLPVKQLPVQIGSTRSGERKLVLQPTRGSRLWQLSIDPVNEKGRQPAVKAYKRNDLILEGEYKKSKFLYTIRNITMLMPIPSV